MVIEIPVVYSFSNSSAFFKKCGRLKIKSGRVNFIFSRVLFPVVEVLNFNISLYSLIEYASCYFKITL